MMVKELSTEGHPEAALKVLDKMKEVHPESNLHFDTLIISAKPFIKAGKIPGNQCFIKF